MKIYDLKDALPLLKAFKKILVTGPQRSGTTIASKIISHELGLTWLKEESVEVDRLDLFFKIHFSAANYVLQAPGVCHLCHVLPVDAIVFMWRASKDIKESVDRIGWMKHNRYECEKYYKLRGDAPSWLIKKKIYRTFQVHNIRNPFTISYQSLRDHQFYVQPEVRKGFHCRQIDVD
jgi:hypothetical protein